MLSKCCKKEADFVSGDHDGDTAYFKCLGCHKPCDIWYENDGVNDIADKAFKFIGKLLRRNNDKQ